LDKARLIRLKMGLALGIVLLSLILWLFPSNVMELIAKQRDVLLGRYSLERFSTLCLLTPVLWLVAYALWASTRMSARQVGFRIAALLFSIGIVVLAMDVAARFIRKPRYIEKRVQVQGNWEVERVDGIVRHRPPNKLYRIRYADVPPTARSYPKAPPGHPEVEITLRTDARGYRNGTDFPLYDMVALGDSFTEGSRVSDDEPWPVLLGNHLGRRVYNLGISGGRPDRYLNIFQTYGVTLGPKVAIFMVYEGNDFKRVKFHKERPVRSAEPFHRRVRKAIKSSPIVKGLRKAFVTYLGPVGADAPVKGAQILSWMPVAVPRGKEAKYYSFEPKRLMRLYWSRAEFEESEAWTGNARVFKMIKDLCARKGIRLIFVYAPSKPHVVMPLVKEWILPEKLRAFALFEESPLPPPAEFKQKLYDRLGTQEAVFRDFCRAEDIEFVSPTAALREMARKGFQVYYTYDQHWTALGHRAVAAELAAYLRATVPTGIVPLSQGDPDSDPPLGR
jgi:hypothetical protein